MQEDAGSMKKQRAAVSTLIVALLLFISCPLAATPYPIPAEGPRYVFLFIGDGMGKTHVRASQIDLEGGATLSAFPIAGEIGTNNKSGGTTDSAAAATALATGYKTSNGKINVSPSGLASYQNIAGFSKSAGRKVGIVSSVPLNHATPSAFYATSDSRSDYYDLGLQLARSGHDYFGGGGILNPRGADGAQTDVRVLAASQGFSLVTTRAGLLALGADAGQTIAFAEALDGESSIAYLVDREAGAQSLADFVAAGIRVLDNPQGFFFVIEGGKIDWASHDNDSLRMLGEMRDFDAAIRVALAFLQDHPDETLVVVTADHETGGLTLLDQPSGSAKSTIPLADRLYWTKTGHSAAKVPVYAQGVGQELFLGFYENTGIFSRLAALLEASLAEDP
jgi:alkaline phosphatase